MRKKLLAGVMALALCSTNMPLQTIFAGEFTSGNLEEVSEETPEIFSDDNQEVKEETGLDVRNAEGGYLFTYKRENPGEGDNYFVDVYRFVMDIDESDLHLQTEETDGYMFATVDEIKAFAAEGKFLHYDSIKQAFEIRLPQSHWL